VQPRSGVIVRLELNRVRAIHWSGGPAFERNRDRIISLSILRMIDTNVQQEVRQMATEKEIYELIGRIVADPAFRASVLEDPEKTIKEAGFDLTEKQLEGLKATDLKAISADLDDRLSKEANWGFGRLPY
jgi:hypothetical protein